MSFLRTSLWGGLSTGITMLAGLITTKYVAIMIGPVGMALTGQFYNLTSVAVLLATGATASGVVKYIAEHKDIILRQRIIANTLILLLFGTIVTACVLALLSKKLSILAFGEHGFQDVLLIYAALLLFPAFNIIASSALNGTMQIRLLASINVFASCLNVGIVIMAAQHFGVKGVLLAGTCSAAITSCIYLYFLKKELLLPDQNFYRTYSPQVMKQMLAFSAMGIVSGIVAPWIQFLVRSKLLHDFGASTAGLWQANTRLSDYYLTFIYTVLGIYYLPKLSSVTEPKALKRELWLGYVRILPAVGVITLIIWCCRDLIVSTLLTNKFDGMLVLLKWQLIGDIIKIAAWLLGFLMIAKAMKTIYIITELIFSSTFVLLSYWAVNHYGMIGTVYAFALNYTLYLLTLAIALRKYIF